jgi:hypothetical protein
MKSLLLTLVFAATSTVASAQLANLDFETGDFTGWTASGDARIYTFDDVEIIGIAPFEGAFGALLVPNSSIVHATGIYLSAGETVSVWMNGSQSGQGSLDLIPNSGPAIHVWWQPVYLPGELFPVKWNEVSFRVQEAGIYMIGASSPEGADGPSFLGVDLFTVTPVPEPSSYGLLAAVSGVAAIMWRRRKASAAVAI